MASLWNLCACMTRSVTWMWPRSRACSCGRLRGERQGELGPAQSRRIGRAGEHPRDPPPHIHARRHLLPCDALVDKRALHHQQLGAIHVGAPVALEQLAARVAGERELRDLGGVGWRAWHDWLTHSSRQAA
jgi:hypothetical protein